MPERFTKWCPAEISEGTETAGRTLEIAVRLTSGAIIWPVQRAMKRFKNGAEDGIAGYGVGMGLQIGPRPARAERRPWWRFWR